MNCDNLLRPLQKNIHLVILGLYAYVLLCHVKDTDYVSMIVLTAVTCIAICYLKNNRYVEGQTNSMVSQVDTATDASPASTASATDGANGSAGANKKPLGSDIVRELPASMGPFDGLCLQTGNKEYWMKSPDNTALIPNDALFSYLSSQGPLKPVFSDA